MNNLSGAFLTDCVRLIPEYTPDGQGGRATRWTDGPAFRAALVKSGSAAGRSAEKTGVSESYAVTTPVGAGLMHGDAFRRVSDGAAFRVTSNYTDTSPPKCAGFTFEQVTAERWDPV